MKTLTMYTLSALVVIGLGGFLCVQYGRSEYSRGYAQARADLAVIVQDTIDKSRLEWEKNLNETQNLGDDLLDIHARQLGILRPDGA